MMTHSSSKFEGIAFVFTPKELCHIAQGCSRSELPWVERNVFIVTLKGLRHARKLDDVTPSGYIGHLDSKPRVARCASNPGLCDAIPSG